MFSQNCLFRLQSKCVTVTHVARMDFPDTPFLFDLGFFQLRWYGVLITFGMVLAVTVAAREARRKGINPAVIWDGALLVIVLGLIGARLYHVFSAPNDGSASGWAYYSRNPLEILAIWKGGLGIYGGIAGGIVGIVGIVIVSFRNRISLRMLFDCVALGVPLAQAIGRWGNFFNQELYGPPTGSSWWGIRIDEAHRTATGKYDFRDMQSYPPGTLFHPTFLYESLWSVLGFGVLFLVSRRFAAFVKDGDIGALYLIWYGVGRTWVELAFRPDAWTSGALPTAVWVSLGAIAFGLFLLAFNRIRPVRRKPDDLAAAVAAA